ncbi:hypothetical protein D3C75_1162170 [compost metagenome]
MGIGPAVSAIDPGDKIVQLLTLVGNGLAGGGEVQVVGQKLFATDQHLGLTLGGGNGGVGIPRRPGIRAAVIQQDSRLTRQQIDELHVVGAQAGTAQGFDR